MIDGPVDVRTNGTEGRLPSGGAAETGLPIHAILPDLLATLRAQTAAVLIAPPGAGKTTAVAPA